MKVAWTTDIHLDHCASPKDFLVDINGMFPDALFITGDIATSRDLLYYLDLMQRGLEMPFYFVLGNHDFYYSSIKDVRERVAAWSNQSPQGHWMPESRLVELTPDTGLIGHDGWYDCRYGNVHTHIQLTDFQAVAEMVPYKPGITFHSHWKDESRLQAQVAVDYIREVLPRACELYDNVIMLTHVPPYDEAAWYMGKHSDPNFLPWFSSKAMGEALDEVMEKYPDTQLQVLCGHTHGGGHYTRSDNIQVVTGEAHYGVPEVVDIWEI